MRGCATEVAGQVKFVRPGLDDQSWRGQWYVVHLGPDWRPGAGGWVCKPDPATVPVDLRRAACAGSGES